MLRHFCAVIGTVTMVLASGCANPGAKISSTPTTLASLSSTSPGGLVGTWRGSSGVISGSQYDVELRLELQINPDGTYVLTATRTTGGNNVGKPFKEAGTVGQKGRQIVLKSSEGSQRTLRRSGDTLYGLEQDFLSEFPVMDRLDQRSG